MCILMLGIDHNKASVEYRELFAFTKTKSSQVMTEIKNIDGVLGSILLSTCNRTELYISCIDSGQEQTMDQIYQFLCFLKGLDANQYKDLFTIRSGNEAIIHLFELACGLQSRILGEDQIITQVKDALALSREWECTDNILETLFRNAITAAKKIKTEIKLSDRNQSVIFQAIYELEKQGFSVQGKRCMVIGNGAMGKAAALALKDAGGDVIITVRQYRSGMVDIPVGCSRINYGERMNYIGECDLVVSATVSPNTTIKYEEMQQIILKKTLVLIDLAVPRDIDPKLEWMEHIKLFDIDSFQIDMQSDDIKENIKAARKILEVQMKEFLNWYECRDVIPKIQTISSEAANDMEQRMQKIIKKLAINEREQVELGQQLDLAATKVVKKMIFGLRDTISQPAFRECIEGLEKLYGTGKQMHDYE